MTGNNHEASLLVAGAGAAGMMAAVTAARAGVPVLLADPNEKVGRKLYITGKGRCNVTNACAVPEVMANLPRNGKFLYSALSRFPPQAAMDFFEGLGVPLKVERGNRVFPVSDRASDIVDAFFFELRRLGVDLVRDRVSELRVENGRLTGAALEGREMVPCKACILATGGVSYPRTGSTGDGYRLAREAGHEIVPVRGSLVPLESHDPDCGRLQGLSLRNVGLKVKNQNGKTVYREQGEMLFTHFGLSGPMVLSASAYLDFARERYAAHIDLKPALDERTLDRRLVRDFEARSNQDLSNALGGLAPRLLIPVLLERSGLPGDRKARDLSRGERLRLLACLKDLAFEISGPRPVEEAIVTAGGVKVGKVNPKTMESKLVGGLYFAGELLDVDGYTGGFNLQIAWCTGRAAGQAAAERLLLERKG